jgi:hypothetical protein
MHFTPQHARCGVAGIINGLAQPKAGDTSMSIDKIPEAWDATLTYMWRNGIIPHHIDRVDVFGYSRTGKSTLIHKLTGSERITLHEQMPLEDLIGGLQLVNGSTQWVDGPAVRALRQGKVLQLDELDVMPFECRTMIYALLDKPAAITLPTGERVTAAPGYAVIATHNPPPSVLLHPIYDRLDVFLKADTLSEGIRNKLGDKLAAVAQNVVGHGQPKLDWERPVTVNSLLAFKALADAGIQDEDAAHLLGFRNRAQADFITVIAR